MSALDRVVNAAVAGMAAAASKDNDLSPSAVSSSKAVLKEEVTKALETPAMDNVAVVDIKSSWFSKINWTQAIGWAASGIVAFLLPYVSSVGLPEQVVAMFTVQTVTAVLTWLFKTFFTNTITPSAAEK